MWFRLSSIKVHSPAKQEDVLAFLLSAGFMNALMPRCVAMWSVEVLIKFCCDSIVLELGLNWGWIALLIRESWFDPLFFVLNDLPDYFAYFSRLLDHFIGLNTLAVACRCRNAFTFSVVSSGFLIMQNKLTHVWRHEFCSCEKQEFYENQFHFAITLVVSMLIDTLLNRVSHCDPRSGANFY